MEFWGAEVKAGQPLKVEPIDGKVVHLSQACLGESKKGVDNVVVSVKIGNQKLVLGTLLPENIPQLSFDLVFEKEFELSHNSKNASVHFAGYQTFIGEEDDSEFDTDSEGEDVDLPLIPMENGKVDQKVEQAKPATTKAKAVKPESSEKQKVKIQEPIKGDEDEDDDDEDDDDESDDEDGSEDESDEDMLEADSDDEDDDSDEEDEETPTPKKKADSKKRPNDSASKTPVSAKKAKSVAATPTKTDGKKAIVHTATPHPAKKGGKTPATADKPKAQTPKSGGGDHSCKSCSKTFGSVGALDSHSKAKHSAAK